MVDIVKSVQKYRTSDGREFDNYNEANREQKKLNDATLSAFDPKESFPFLEKHFQRVRNNFHYPMMLLARGKYSNYHFLINTVDDLVQHSLSMVKARLESGYYYQDEDELIATAIVENGDGKIAFSFLINRKGGYESVDIEYFTKDAYSEF